LKDNNIISYSNLSNNNISINIKDYYNYPYSNKLQFSCNNDKAYPFELTSDTLKVNANFRNDNYNIRLIAYDPKFTYNSEYGLSRNTQYSNLINSNLIFSFQEILPPIRFKDTYSNYHIVDISSYSGNNFTITQDYLKSNIFIKAIESCNIIISSLYNNSSFKNYTVLNNNLEINIIFDYKYIYNCNLVFSAYLQNFQNNVNLSAVLRIVLPDLGPPLITNDKKFYNLIGNEYIDPITNRIEFNNVFKNIKTVENLEISIYDISDNDMFNYENNMIYTYLKPTVVPTVVPVAIDFNKYNKNCNEIGPYYSIDNNNFYSIIYVFKNTPTNINYNITFNDVYDKCNLDILVVGGGGSRVTGNNTLVGNEGSSGDVIHSNIAIIKNSVYTVTVGDGGFSNMNGSTSSFNNIVALGGIGGKNEKISKMLRVAGSKSTIFKPAIGKYQGLNSISLYSIYPNSNIGHYNNNNIYFGGGRLLPNKVYSCGLNILGQLGRITSTYYDIIPTEITGNISNSNIIAISAGGYHSLFLDLNGKVYSCGHQDYGQIGRTPKKTYAQVYSYDDIAEQITATIGDCNITAISAGKDHSLFLDSNGKVYSCGMNKAGQLGRNTTETTGAFKYDDKPIQITSNIVAISAGNEHSLFLDSNGKVYSCGQNLYGQLGRITTKIISTDPNYLSTLGSNIKYDDIITQITDNISDIVAISAGGYHSLFLDSNGRVYSCGQNRCGQLGRITSNIVILHDGFVVWVQDYQYDDIPVQITNISNIVAISAGNEHSLFLDSNGKVYSCGHNSFGELARNTTKELYYSGNGQSKTLKYDDIVTQITNISNIVAISAGDLYSLFLDSKGKVYSCGRTYYGEIGKPYTKINYSFVTPYAYGYDDTLTELTNISNIVDISASSAHHSLFITANTTSVAKTQAEIENGYTLPGKIGYGAGGVGSKGESGIVLLKYTVGYNYNIVSKYDSISVLQKYTIEPLFYKELSVSASNMFGSKTETLRFIKTDFNTLTIPGLTSPTYEITLATDKVTCNINSDFEIMHTNINNITKDNQNLIISNLARDIDYDIIIKESNYNYVYRFIEEGYRGPVLINSEPYFQLIDNTQLNPITHKIEFNVNTIFSNTKVEDSLLPITLTFNDNFFGYSNNILYTYLKPTYKQNNIILPENVVSPINLYFNNYNINCNEVGPYYSIDNNNFYNVFYAFKYNPLNPIYNITFNDDYNGCNLDVLVVGGGGGGGNGNNILVGNGGSGGQVIHSNISIMKNSVYIITVGDGGSSGMNGSNSSFNNIIANGGMGGTNESIPITFYENNYWIKKLTLFDIKIQGARYSNIEEIVIKNNNPSILFDVPKLSIGAGSNISNPSIGKYQGLNYTTLYSIYPNSNIGYYNNENIYFGNGGLYGNRITTINKLPNKVYSCGINTRGQLGRTTTKTKMALGGSELYDDIPTQITTNLINSNIIAISAQEYHSLFLDSNGKVYSCGLNNYGQLGRTTTLFSVGYYRSGSFRLRLTSDTIPEQITSNIGECIIIAIIAGIDFSLFLDSNGKVYSCGRNDYGQIGRTDSDTSIPKQITSNIGECNIVAISAGFDHSLFLDSNGKVYSCGQNLYGQLGRITTKMVNGYLYDDIPEHITSNIGECNIIAISTYEYHSLFLDSNGKVYSCGTNDYGQLGRITTKNENGYLYDDIPEQITSNLSNIIAISAGRYHSLFLDLKGKVYSCGQNNYGQLGRTNSDTNIPMQITSNIGECNIVAISAGVLYSLFLDSNGKVYSCGINHYGETGRTDLNSYTHIPIQITSNLSNIVAINATSDHSLFITANITITSSTNTQTELNVYNSPGSGGGGAGGSINNIGTKGGSGLVLLKYNTGYKASYVDNYYCNIDPLIFYKELSVSASNIYGSKTETLNFVRLGYNTLTVPNLLDNKVNNIYLSGSEITYNIGTSFDISYNPINPATNLEISGSNLKIKDNYIGRIYDIIINLGNYVYNILRINERVDNTDVNTYSLSL
jgi:alpha-tubulin suppressor-like RCC1 family protein